MRFRDRRDGGRQLADRLLHLAGEDVVVLGLPRGGVPVAAEVAARLGAPLDVIMVRKLGVPFQPELAMGAIGEGDVRVLDEEVVRVTRVTTEELRGVEGRERLELERRAHVFRGGRPRVPLAGRTAVVVDDGVATGSTARAACLVARAQGAARVVLAVPVAPAGWEARMGGVADELVAVATPEGFMAVGQFYADFHQTSDDDVVRLLRGGGPTVEREIEIPVGRVRLQGHLSVPGAASGLVVFAHGSGSSRHSPRNRYVAGVLQEAGLATLLFDLLTPAEERDRDLVFDIELLSHRLLDVSTWVEGQPVIGELPLGYFGASTGSAAALMAAAEPDAPVAAVVSRGGRPDLASPKLGAVRAPTLLIVGGDDPLVLDMNRRALAQLPASAQLVVVPGATHLFEEPGTLAAAADQARAWFLAHLAPERARGRV